MESGTTTDPEHAEGTTGSDANGGAPEPDLEGEGTEEQAQPEIEIEGEGQLSLKIGGRKPDKATVKLRGGSIAVRGGQYEKGDHIDVAAKLVCAEVHLVDKVDNQTGEIIETERRQIFKIKGIEKI